jgi:hypothetical protein
MKKRQELSHRDIERLQDKVIDDYFWKHYWNQEAGFGGLCSLCGNSGVIDTRETANSGANVKAGRLNYCLCLNGRAMREANAPLLDAQGRAAAHLELLKAVKAKHDRELKAELDEFRKGN